MALVVVAVVGIVAYNLFFAPWDIDERNFPDVAVRNAISATADTNHDGKLSRTEANAVTELTVDGAASFAHMGKFLPHLAKLTLKGSSLATLDTSDIGGLENLDARGTSIKAVDVSHNGNLKSLGLESSVEVSGLDKTGLKEVWLPSELTMSFTPSSNDFSEGETSPQRQYTATYNPDGTIAQISDAYNNNYYYDHTDPKWETEDTVDYTYKDGRAVSEKRTDAAKGTSRETTFTYDDAGHLVKRSDSSGAVDYVYDDKGRLIEIKGMSGLKVTYAYDNQGRAIKIASASVGAGGMTSTYSLSYDDVGNLISYTTQDKYPSGESLPSYSYTYDNDGKLTQITSTSPGITVALGYDKKGRIASVTKSYTLDPDNPSKTTVTYDDVKRTIHADHTSTYKGKTEKKGATDWKSGARVFVAKDADAPTAAFDPNTMLLTGGNSFGINEPGGKTATGIPTLISIEP